MYKKAFELSYKNKKVEIEIQDFVGDVRNINGTEDLFSLSYISDSKDKGQSILVTEADINFYADDYFNIDELKTVGETDIKVKYYEDDALLWSGFVIPDFFSTSVDIAPVVSMVATDRIGTLKEISNNAESNIPIQILASCLKQTGQDLPINLIADNNHFETPIQLERIEDIASYDVIRTFMVLFNCKITLYKNAWWIINKKLLETGFINYKSYNSDGVGGSVTPFAQPILDINLVDRDGQREIKPTASEISLFLEFGGSKKYPNNWNFEKLNKTAKLFDSWSNHAGFEQGWRDKRILFYVYDSGYYNAWFTDEDTEKISLWYRFYWYNNKISDNILDYPNLRSEFVKVPTDTGIIEISLNGSFTTRDGNPVLIMPIIHNKTTGKYYTYNRDGEIASAGNGSLNFDLSKIDFIHNPRTSTEDGFNFDDLTHEVVNINWDIKNKFNVSDFGSDTDKLESQIIFIGGVYLQGALDLGIDIFINSVQISFNDSQVTGKGLIFKIKQGGEKFSKSRDPETILFSDKINQGVNGHFYNYKYDDTSIVDLPSEFALSSVRERADMFSKARDYYSLDGNFIVNPLAKYTCGLKSFVLIGGENRREDAGIIVEEIVSNTLNRTDFIYTYFDDGKDKVKSIGTASGGSSSSGGGGAVSTPQLWKVDEDGNIYTEYNAYSLKELSAFGLGEEEGGGVIINVIDSLDSTSKTDPLSANMGRYLKTLIDNIEVGEGGQVIVDWEAITGIPDTFVPSAHTHIIGDVTGLQGALDDKASLSQLDDKEDKFTKNSAFNKNFGTESNDVARGNHTHAFESLTSIPTTLSGYGITDAYTKTNVDDLLSNKAGKPSTLTASTTNEATDTSHTHAITTTSVGAANTIIQTNESGGIHLYNLAIGDWSLLTEYSGNFFTIKHGGENKMRISTSGSGNVEFYGNLFSDGDITAAGNIISDNDVRAWGLIAYETVITPQLELGDNWKLEQSGSELVFKYNDVVAQRFLSDGSIVGLGEISAFGAGESGGSGGGSISMMQGWTFTTETENYYLPAKLAVPFYDDTRSRLSTLEAGTAPASHTHPISDITNLQTALNSKQATLTQGSNITIVDNVISAVDTTYDVATTSANGLMSSTDKSKLNGIAKNANNYSLPTASDTVLGGIKVGSRLSIASGVLSATQQTANDFTTVLKNKLDGIESNANNYSLPTASDTVIGGVKVGARLTITSGTLSADSQTENNFTTVLKNKLDGIESGANNYTHPSYTARASGLYKVTVDNLGHISNATAVDKSDITELGIPAQDTTYAGSTSVILVSGSFQRAALTGDVTSAQNSNATSIANTVVTGKTLQNYVVGANTALLATDTILGAFGKVQGQIDAIPRGTVTSVGLSVPTGLSVANSPITSNGTLAISLATGYSIPTTEKQSNWDTAFTNNHTHDNKGVIDKLTQADLDVLGLLSIVDGNLRIDANTYSTGNLSAFGLGEDGGGSGGGIIETVYGYGNLGQTFNNATLTDTFNAYTINQLHTRLSAVESGAALSIVQSGSGNAVTSVTKSGTALTVTKGLNFSQVGHTHSASDITSGILATARLGSGTASSSNFLRGDGTWAATPNTVYTGTNGITVSGTTISPTYGTAANTIAQGNDSRINNGQTAYEWGNHATAGYALNSAFSTHNTDNVRHITGEERSKWNTVVTDFAGLEIGGRNLILRSTNLTNISSFDGSTISIISNENGEVSFIASSGDESSQLKAFWGASLSEEKVVGNTYTASAWVKNTRTDTTRILVGWNGFSEGKQVYEILPEDGWVLVKQTGKASTSNTQLQFSSNTPILSVSASFKKPMLQEGNKETGWELAPEDQVSDWNTTDVNSFSFIKNKPTKLSEFSNDLGNYGSWITKAQGDGYYAPKVHTHPISDVTNLQDTLDKKLETTVFNTHIDNKSNPHSVTKAQVGLGSVDNTSDLLKPISNATQDALDLKVTLNTPQTITGDKIFEGRLSILSSYSYLKINRMGGNNTLLVGADATHNAIYSRDSGSGVNPLRIVVGNTDVMRFSNDYNVGIGTTNPQYKLDVSGTGRFTGALTAPKVSFGNGWTAEGVGAELQFKLNGVIQAKIVNGALVSTGEVTAHQ